MKRLILAISLLSVLACDRTGIEVKTFGRLETGEEVHTYLLKNHSGASMLLCDYGARIISIRVPDRDGLIDDVVVGYGNLEQFEKEDRFIGCVIGRYANRIDGASFCIDGIRYHVTANENFDGAPVQCHGGPEGFDRFIWDAAGFKERDCRGVRFSRMSPDGEEGFPGNCFVTVTYRWTDDNVCKIDYEATSDKATVINLSNHTYFNLKGSKGGSVMDHNLCVAADSCIQNNLHYCPDIVFPVNGTPFDFREPNRIDYKIDMPSRQLEIMKGMSACWKVRDWNGTLKRVSTLEDRKSGRVVETWSTEPGLLIYTGRGFDPERYQGKYGPIEQFGGLLLETIHFADSPNQPRFPDTILRPGEVFHSSTEWRFGTSPLNEKNNFE